ncbi:DUF1622 domain-containing protein [Brevundimonas sp.]|uniref:DUF1622 domain-containing protein n=1 Tax=Brevundimonas sp. TaxID=1871086 RepID=UPI00289A396D|nr:DUF1622 domain-containing protein [Brevundimonas sp.]
MEELLTGLANYVALGAEIASVVCIAVGMIEALIRVVVVLGERRLSYRDARRGVFTGFASWIVLALEFALAADIARTAIAPTWDDIGRLAAIAVIRTVLNYFLEKDLAEFGSGEEEGQGETRKRAG